MLGEVRNATREPCILLDPGLHRTGRSVPRTRTRSLVIDGSNAILSRLRMVNADATHLTASSSGDGDQIADSAWR